MKKVNIFKIESINKILFLIFFLLLFFLNLNTLFSQDTINNLVNLMKNRYANINDYQGKIVLQVTDKGVLQEGEIFYKYPGKFKIEINSPEKKIYVCDGKTLYIYYPSMSVVGIQNIKRGSNNIITYGQSKETLGYIFDAYTFNFSEGKSLYQFNNFKVYKIKGWAKRVEAGFKSLELYVDETGFIVYQSAVNLEGKTIKYYFISYKVNQDLSDLLFNFNIPDNVQIIENIFE
ncbi:MAG: LolA family protein [Exilispira sp.]